MSEKISDDRFKTSVSRERLDQLWIEVCLRSEQDASLTYLSDPILRDAIRSSINHVQVAYRFCLLVQVLGKLLNPKLNCLALQRGKDGEDKGSWDARSLASRVVARFNIAQENVLGTSADPYVGNAMRIPLMLRDDPSKKDVLGWNTLIDVLETVEDTNDVHFTEFVFKQVLLEFKHRQRSLNFSYPVPPRVSIQTTIALGREFLKQRSGGDRAQAVAGALFDVIGTQFGLFSSVRRGQINSSDEASGQVADLECINEAGKIVMAVEVKDRGLKLADIEGAIIKTRQHQIRDLFFAVPHVEAADVPANAYCRNICDRTEFLYC